MVIGMVKKSKKTYIYIIVFIIIIFVLVNPTSRQTILGLFNYSNRSEKELELINEFTVDASISNLGIYNERIIEAKDNSLLFLDFNGFEVFKEESELNNPDILYGEKSIYIMDSSSGKINIYDKEGEEVKNIDVANPFYRLEEKEDEIFIFRKDGDQENIDIVNREGSIVQTHLENIPILTADIADSKEDYLVSTLDIDKELKSILTVYSIDGEERFHIDIEDEIVIYSKFIKEDILVATEKSLYYIKDEKIKWEKDYENIKDVEIRDNEILILYDNNYEILNLRGKIKKEIVLNVNLEKILLTNDEVFIFGKNNIIIPERKKNRLNFKSEEEILDLKYDDDNLLIEKENKIEIYKLKGKGDK